ncbi:MAG: hypothetical protein HON90_00120 [Halobacteriovoraceae bacterium]|jgi:hypothetical protein|nr:hypothetical protein [Halobacteriovoraceae bacterium]
MKRLDQEIYFYLCELLECIPIHEIKESPRLRDSLEAIKEELDIDYTGALRRSLILEGRNI